MVLLYSLGREHNLYSQSRFFYSLAGKFASLLLNAVIWPTNASPTSLPYVGKQLTVLLHTQ